MPEEKKEEPTSKEKQDSPKPLKTEEKPIKEEKPKTPENPKTNEVKKDLKKSDNDLKKTDNKDKKTDKPKKTKGQIVYENYRKKFECEECGKTITGKFNLERHLKAHERKKKREREKLGLETEKNKMEEEKTSRRDILTQLTQPKKKPVAFQKIEPAKKKKSNLPIKVIVVTGIIALAGAIILLFRNRLKQKPKKESEPVPEPRELTSDEKAEKEIKDAGFDFDKAFN